MDTFISVMLFYCLYVIATTLILICMENRSASASDYSLLGKIMFHPILLWFWFLGALNRKVLK